MANFDSVEESRRLQQLYAQLSEDDLQAVADDGYDLTDAAKDALQAEIRGRGLKIDIRDAPAPPEADPATTDFDASDLELVVLQRVWDSAEAVQVRQILSDGGIASYLGPDNLEDVGALRSFEGGVDLKIREVDTQRAGQALSNALPPEPLEDSEYVPCCPKCHSPEIVFQSLDHPPTAESSFDSKFNWSCDACGYEWKDDGIEPEK